MPVQEDTLAALRKRVGTAHSRRLGEVSDVLIRRYARAVGETNPLYFDREYARAYGHPDIVAPPNLVTAIQLWDEGPAEADLRHDGTPHGVLHGLPHADQVRTMGGGEEMRFHAPITAGTVLHERTTLVDITTRESRSGPMAVLRYEDVYHSEDGTPFLTTIRTRIFR